MNERQIRSFVLATDLGSISKAAANSYVSTPALLQQINLLERSLGFKLFTRSPTGIVLTDSGRFFYDKATKILELIDESREVGSSLEKSTLQKLRIGCAPEEIAPFLPRVCELFRKEHGILDMEFVIVPYAQQMEALAAKRFDVAFFPQPLSTKEMGIGFECLYEDGYFCCMSPSDPLAEKDVVELSDLAGQRVYMERLYSEQLESAHLVERLREEGIDFTLDSTPFTKALATDIMLEGGVLPVPGRYTEACVPPLVSVPLNWPSGKFGMIYRNGCSDTARRFIETAKEYFKTTEQ